MRKPDACSLLTSRHLLCPNCPLVLFLFSLSHSFFLSQVSYGHRKLHPARPLVRHEQVPCARSRVHTRCLSRFVLPYLFCFISTWTLDYFNPVVRVQTTQGEFPDFLFHFIDRSIVKQNRWKFHGLLLLLFYSTFILTMIIILYTLFTYESF